jgi:hypothetical protein
MQMKSAPRERDKVRITCNENLALNNPDNQFHSDYTLDVVLPDRLMANALLWVLFENYSSVVPYL